MFNQILIAHDGSDSARKAFDVAVQLEKDRADSYFGQLAEHCRTRAAMHSVDIGTVIVPGNRSAQVAGRDEQQEERSGQRECGAVTKPGGERYVGP